MTVRTRFAPSPTGYLHIGGVRTALFNWLFARHHGGQFILRIDDTDAQRNVEEALKPILDGLRWLGLDWDEGPEVDGPHAPYYQSQRLDRYQAAVHQLIESGHAYRDYARTEELQIEREAAQKEGRPFIYDRKYMADTPEKRTQFEAEGRQGVVRLKMPREGKLVLDDLVRGHVEFDWSSEQDHVIERADGTCLYHLATVVDDHDFEITHVIRAEEHLSNTPRQVFIAQSLGYELPEYAHLPYVAEPGSKNKLSKRKLDKYLKNPEFKRIYEHGANIASKFDTETTAASPGKTSQTLIFKASDGRDLIIKNADTFNPVIVDFYREVGYLPDAIINYLLLLGWSLDDKTEDFTRKEMIEHFSLERVNRAPASFDPQKLMAFQARVMQQLTKDERVAMVMPYLQKVGWVEETPSVESQARVAAIVEAAGDRVAVAGDVLDYAEFFTRDDALAYDEKAFEKRLRKAPDAASLLAKFKDQLATAEPFDAPSLESLLHDFVETKEIKIGQIIHAVRVAVTGRAVGFGLFETLTILGRESCLARIDRALKRIAS